MLREEHVRLIADKARHRLEIEKLLIPGKTAVYIFPKSDRAILIFDSDALRSPEKVVHPTFVHRLSTALGGVRVLATNSRGVFLQVGYSPPPGIKLISQPLDLSQQISSWHVPIGITKNGPLWLSMIDMDSILIGGTRRMGKTNLLHTWILALIHGGEVMLILWDGKSGIEFGRYAGRDNVMVVDKLEQAFQYITNEIARRTALFKAEGVNSLPAYNQKSKAKLAVLVLFIDEAALIPEELQGILINLIRVGGAYGLHPVIATQRPDVEAVKGALKGNLTTRISLPVPSRHDSVVILGRTGAEKIPKEKGRLMMDWEARTIQAQAYLAPLDDTQPQSSNQSLITQRELNLVQAALDLGGWFRITEIAQAAGESRDWVNDVAKRWEHMGYLTPVQRNAKGHPEGRKVTDTLLESAGLGGSGDLADWADQADLESVP